MRYLYCQSCGGEWSAHKGDYFLLPDSHVFECQECEDSFLDLVEKGGRFAGDRVIFTKDDLVRKSDLQDELSTMEVHK